MTQKFDLKNKVKLDSPERREFLPPYKILSSLGLKKNDKVADVGAGTGYFTIPISEIVGEKGLVFALDTELEMIEEIEKKIKLNTLKNIRTIVSEEYDLKIDDSSVDFTLVSFVLHEVKDIDVFIRELIRVTSKEGKIAIIDWIKKDSDIGPPIEHRLDKDLLKIVLENNELLFDEIEINNELYSYVINLKSELKNI